MAMSKSDRVMLRGLAERLRIVRTAMELHKPEAFTPNVVRERTAVPGEPGLVRTDYEGIADYITFFADQLEKVAQ